MSLYVAVGLDVASVDEAAVCGCQVVFEPGDLDIPHWAVAWFRHLRTFLDKQSRTMRIRKIGERPASWWRSSFMDCRRDPRTCGRDRNPLSPLLFLASGSYQDIARPSLGVRLL